MADQIIITIQRPDVGIKYNPESPEAEMLDELASMELGFHALSRHIRHLFQELGMRVPDEVTAVYNSDAAKRGL